jgi:hypothetical protein
MWTQFVVISVQTALLSLLLYHWVAALLSHPKYERLCKVIRISFLVFLFGLTGSGLGLIIYFTADPADAKVVIGALETYQGITRYGELLLWFMISISWILLMLVLLVGCCVLGLCMFGLEGHSRTAVLKSLTIYLLLVFGFTWRALLFYSQGFVLGGDVSYVGYSYIGSILYSLQVLAEIFIAFPLLLLALLGVHASKKQIQRFSLLGDLDKSTALLGSGEEMTVPENYRDF